MPPILITSQFVSSSNTFSACGAGTLRLSSLIKSRALMMMYGSYVFLVVSTVIEPSTRFNSHATPCSFKAFVIDGHVSLKYFSLYFGNSTAKELSSTTPPGLSSLVNGSMRQRSVPSMSHGLSRLYRPCFPADCVVVVVAGASSPAPLSPGGGGGTVTRAFDAAATTCAMDIALHALAPSFFPRLCVSLVLTITFACVSRVVL
mmetsp:Transcript_339/g.1169  ORF Transcript_339/g.1169 Transcript_339/m.1169 type:complete len:203 (+) Transcript_339:831-1439(+)